MVIKNMRMYPKDEENIEKHRIRQCAYYNLKDELLREFPKYIICGEINNLEIHHEEYDNSNLKKLKVMCRSCHKELHILN